jgi:cytidine deaminase
MSANLEVSGIEITDEIRAKLLTRARAVLRHSYSPYSKFAVGASVLTDDGSIYDGVNVENASYGLTNCAERAAIFTAIADGKRRIRAIAIVSSGGAITVPCGACRQVLAEFAPDAAEVLVENGLGGRRIFTMGELLPHSFRSANLPKTR